MQDRAGPVNRVPPSIRPFSFAGLGQTGYLGHSARAQTAAKGGAALPASTQALIEKIQALPAERIAEVEDFVDFIRLREQDRTLTRFAAATSAPAFAAIWNNPDDDAYDAL
jgi:hypothetical protein